MNPDVAQSVLPLTSSDLSLMTLFWHAHWIVKAVMLGLMVASVWVWAIVIDKSVLYARSRREMSRFEQIFWSGTVWGIMTSFQSIAASKNTSLAVVAPGIAEALFATAIGLIAAIPATIFYNKFASEVNKQAQRLEGFADEFAAILSRQIDERGSA